MEESKIMEQNVKTTSNSVEETSLRDLHQNARMALESVLILQQVAEENAFRLLLSSQYNRYVNILEELEVEAKKHKIVLHDNTFCKRLMLKMNVGMQTITDKSSTKLAEMMIQGLNMGIISLTKTQHNQKENNLDTTLTDKFMSIMEKCLEELKTYL